MSNTSLQKVSVLNKIRSVVGRIMQRAEVPVRLGVKFFGFLFLFRMISGWEAFASLDQTGLFHSGTVQMVLAVMATLLPNRCGVFIAFALITYNVFQVSLLGSVLVGLVLMLLFICASSLFPDEVFLIVLVPACISMNHLLAVPLVAGLYMGATAVIPVVIGVLVYGFYNIIPLFMGLQMDGSLDGIPKLIAEASKSGVNELMSNDSLVYLMVVFSAIILLTALIRMLHVNYSRYIALGAGSIFGVVALMVGASKGNIAGGSLLMNSLILIGVLIVLELLNVPLSYKSAMAVEFEDDSYVYKVRMIPKMSDSHMIPGGRTTVMTLAERKEMRRQRKMGVKNPAQVPVTGPVPMGMNVQTMPPQAPMPGMVPQGTIPYGNEPLPMQGQASPAMNAPVSMPEEMGGTFQDKVDLTLAPGEVQNYTGDFSEFGLKSEDVMSQGTFAAGGTRVMENAPSEMQNPTNPITAIIADDDTPTDLFSDYNDKP